MADTVYSKLLQVQRDLKVEKGQWNAFGKYKYRSKEDILEAAKPVCHQLGLVVLCTDECVTLPNGWVYVHATASVVDSETGNTITADGWAREPETKKGMDGSQITGTAASYAGKRALGNLFAIDDTKDSDTPQQKLQKQIEDTNHEGPFIAHCESCGTRYTFQDIYQFKQFVANPQCCQSPRWVFD